MSSLNAIAVLAVNDADDDIAEEEDAFDNVGDGDHHDHDDDDGNNHDHDGHDDDDEGGNSARPSSLADESHQTLWLPIVSTQSHLCQRIHLIGRITVIVIILNIIINERSHHPLTELESIMMIVSESRKGK